MLACCLAVSTVAQTKFRKGSYGSYGPMKLEDNSIFLEEAFNQGMGSIQYVSTASVRNSSEVDYSFTQEIPITDRKHHSEYQSTVSL